MTKKSFVAERANSFLGAVLASFFVYNTPTMAVPTVLGGVFMLVVVAYITYEFYHYKGLKKRDLAEVFVASFLIAALLGLLFGQATIEQLTSEAFFTSRAFIAFLAALPMTALVGAIGGKRKR